MRLDKFLKVSRLIKRRTVANEICSAGRVVLNGRIAKPGSEVGHTRVRVLDVRSTVRKEEAAELYEMLTDET